MAKKKNTFTPDLESFLTQSVDLLHLLHFMPWQLKMARSQTEKSLDVLEKRGIRDNFGPATGSSIVDIFHDGEYVVRAPVGKRITRGDDVTRLASEMEGRFNATVLVSLHEALETYLKNLYGKMLYQLRNEITLREKKRFHKAHPQSLRREGTPTYYREYARWSCRRDCVPALKAFQSELDWSSAIIDGWSGLDWIAVARTLGFCRHCIVHGEGHIADEDLSKLDASQKKLVKLITSSSLITGRNRLLPAKDITERFMEAIMSFAYGLYVLLARRCSMKLDVNPWKTK